MILEAISALNDKNGCNKSAISKYTETKYGNLLPSHWSLLTAHLAGMKDTGSLLFIKNNYFKPGSDAPRKPKLLPRGTILPPPRPRGRPPKPKDPLAAAVAKFAAGFSRPHLGARPRPLIPLILLLLVVGLGLSRRSLSW
ncbi:HMG-Y-related protein A-like [Musa acuminata AAA Group]|uniref:HMG-Y-related protein A-like n=1 Tax=Musa acuminata AAA Group TaxID=214697 RepID=UPI0031DDB906